MRTLSVAWLFASVAFANPYFDERRVPLDPPSSTSVRGFPTTVHNVRAGAISVLRVDVEWTSSETYRIVQTKLEASGTPALLARARRADALGSYQGRLVTKGTNATVAYDSVGTGREFRKLTRAMTFRFPVPSEPVEFQLLAENPQSGARELVLQADMPAAFHLPVDLGTTDANVRVIQPAKSTPALKIVIYAEGYAPGTQTRFWGDAGHVAQTLADVQFPLLDQVELTAVFAPSNLALGAASKLGLPVAERDSFLGLYFPYWEPFGRWYHVVYPTRESKYRDALAVVPYDYPVILIDDAHYWGVGNFNELTAIPARHSAFSYLLTHEFGHFFGLNEEYEGGGRTELEFAPSIAEPWSQNIAFLAGTALKWQSLLTPDTPVPTSPDAWNGNGPYGAYSGGYGDSESNGKSHKPGFGCVMENGRRFCPICRRAIEAKLTFDLGR